MLGEPGLKLMAAAIMISTFGCQQRPHPVRSAGVLRDGARRTCSSSPPACCIRDTKTPAVALVVQAVWTSLLCLSGTYTQLLNFVIFAALVFYGLTAVGLFALRVKRPAADRPVRAPGYPWLPALYVIATAVIAVDLLVQDATRTYSFLGLGLVLLGVRCTSDGGPCATWYRDLVSEPAYLRPCWRSRLVPYWASNPNRHRSHTSLTRPSADSPAPRPTRTARIPGTLIGAPARHRSRGRRCLGTEELGTGEG